MNSRDHSSNDRNAFIECRYFTILFVTVSSHECNSSYVQRGSKIVCYFKMLNKLSLSCTLRRITSVRSTKNYLVTKPRYSNSSCSQRRRQIFFRSYFTIVCIHVLHCFDSACFHIIEDSPCVVHPFQVLRDRTST